MAVLRGNGWVRFLLEAGEDVPSALLAVGTATCATAVRVAASPPVGGDDPVFLAALAGVFFCGLATMWAAFWVAADEPRRSTTGRIILCAAFVPLVVAVGLSGSDDAKLLFEDMI